MYTGFFIQDNCICNSQGKTSYFLNNKQFHSLADAYLGYYLAAGHGNGVDHIYGPDGYTKYYVQSDYVYGPSKDLPWEVNTS